jgi:hypothetical protein
MVQSLPDLYDSLKHFSITPDLVPGFVTANAMLAVSKEPDQDEKCLHYVINWSIRMNEVQSDWKEALKLHFTQLNPESKCDIDIRNNLNSSTH